MAPQWNIITYTLYFVNIIAYPPNQSLVWLAITMSNDEENQFNKYMTCNDQEKGYNYNLPSRILRDFQQLKNCISINFWTA